MQCGCLLLCVFFFFKQKTAYEMRISDWSSDVCSSDLLATRPAATISARAFAPLDRLLDLSARFSTESTCWLLPKGRNAVKELALLPQPWQSLFHVEQSRTDAASRILVGRGHIAPKKRGKG